VVETADQFLGDNRTDAAINKTIGDICNSLPEPLNSTCHTFASQLVTILAKGVDPKDACKEIGWCDSSSVEVSLPVKKTVELPTDDLSCELCKLVIETADNFLKENATEQEINATISNLCNSLPDPLNATCHTFSSQLVVVLAKGVDPKKACVEIAVCVTVSSSWETKLPEKRIVKVVETGPECELCEFLMETVNSYLKDNKTEAAINATVWKICNDLPPGALKNYCLIFEPTIVKKLVEGVDPKTACTDIKLCSKHTDNHTAVRRSVQISTDTGVVCQLCEQFVKVTNEHLNGSSSAAAINRTVFQICDDLMPYLKEVCVMIAPKVSESLSNGENVTKACVDAGMCMPEVAKKELASKLSAVLLNPRASLAQQENVGNISKCSICKDHVKILDQDLYREEGEIQKFMDGICHRLPPPTDQACLTFADENLPEIYESFLNGTASPDSLCKLLGFCQ